MSHTSKKRGGTDYVVAAPPEEQKRAWLLHISSRAVSKQLTIVPIACLFKIAQFVKTLTRDQVVPIISDEREHHEVQAPPQEGKEGEADNDYNHNSILAGAY